MKCITWLIAPILLSGCAANHLVYVHNAVLGIDLSVSAESTTRFTVGYDRETVAIVPKKAKNKDAMTLVSVDCVYGKAMDEVRFNHFVATGTPAKRLAAEAVKDDAKLTAIRDAIYGGTDKCD